MAGSYFSRGCHGNQFYFILSLFQKYSFQPFITSAEGGHVFLTVCPLLPDFTQIVSKIIEIPTDSIDILWVDGDGS